MDLASLYFKLLSLQTQIGLVCVLCTVYTLYRTLLTVHCTLYTVHCTLYTAHRALCPFETIVVWIESLETM